VHGADRADEKELALAVGDLPDVGGTIGAGGHEPLAVRREALGEYVAVVVEGVKLAPGARVPDPRRVVVAAAREQLPVRAEGERADPGLGQTSDHATGARVEDPCGRRLYGPGGHGKDLARRIEGSREDAAAESDGFRPPGREVDEANVGSAPDQ